MKMTFTVRNVLLLMFLLADLVASQNETSTKEPQAARPLDRRPSFWTKTAHHLKTSTPLRRQYNRAMLRRVAEEAKPKSELENLMKEFMNETAKLFQDSEPQGRSYAVEEPQQNQVWDDKDQAYASSYPSADYETSPYHHHYGPPPHPVPVHYYAPQKKDDSLFTKFALLALLKLILAKLKAIGVLKFILFFLLKIPLLFFKFLFILKGLKLLKIVSIPFLIASFFAPFLPLIPLLAPLLLLPLLFLPLLIPLLLPLLLFLPIIPVTTPPTAAGRRKRGAVELLPITNSTWTPLDDRWKAQIEGEKDMDSRARYFKTRARPVTMEKSASRPDWRFAGGERFEQYNAEESENLIDLTQRVVQSGHCLERAACELATTSDSKLYQTAVIWILGKFMNFAPEGVKRKIEKYSQAYETGAQRSSSSYCQERFSCQRPRIVLIQGKSAYNVF